MPETIEATTNIFQWMVDNGYIAGDPNYYLTGTTPEAEMRHAFVVGYQAIQGSGDQDANTEFWQRLVDEGYIEGNPAYYSTGQAAPEEFEHAFDVASTAYPTSGGATTGGDGAVPAGGERVKILDGAKWYYDSGTDLWYASYTLPKTGREIIFEATTEDVEAIFGAGSHPAAEITSLSDLVRGPNVTFGGQVGEVEGEGTFIGQVNRVIALALDEGKLPDWATLDGKVEELLFIAVSEGKSDNWLIEQMTSLESFKNRFPGYEAYHKLGLSAEDSVAAHLQAEYNLKQLEIQFGGNADRITPQVVGQIANQGYSMTDIGKAYSVFKRMQDFAPALGAFNEVLQASGLNPLASTEDMYQFLSGSAPADVYEIYESSALREAAHAAGVDDLFSADDAIAAAAAAPFAITQERAYAVMQTAAQNLLRFRSEINLGKHDLDVDDLIDLALGIEPRSGKSAADIQEAMNAALGEARGFLKQRVTPFFGFTPSGRPQAQSFAELREESI